MEAKKKMKPRGKPFAKGSNPNPDGRPKLPPEEKTIKVLTEIMLVRSWGSLMSMPTSELYLVVNQNHPNQELNTGTNAAMASTIIKGIEYGSLNQINTALDRVIGPVKQKVEHSGKLELADLVLEANARDSKEVEGAE